MVLCFGWVLGVLDGSLSLCAVIIFSVNDCVLFLYSINVCFIYTQNNTSSKLLSLIAHYVCMYVCGGWGYCFYCSHCVKHFVLLCCIKIVIHKVCLFD